MDARDRIESLLKKIFSLKPEADFRALYETEKKNRGRHPMEEKNSIDNAPARRPVVIVVDKISSLLSPLKDCYVIVAAIEKPLSIVRCDGTGKQIIVDSIQVRKLLQKLDKDIDKKAEKNKGSHADAEEKEERVGKPLEDKEIEKYQEELGRIRFLGHTKERGRRVKNIRISIKQLEEAKVGKEKTKSEIVQLLSEKENKERIENIRKSPVIHEIIKQLSHDATAREKKSTVEKIVELVRSVMSDWSELNQSAQMSGADVMELLADHFSKMEPNIYQGVKAKLDIFKKAVDAMPDASQGMDNIKNDILKVKRIMNDMSKALALIELKPDERIVYQHVLNIVRITKSKNIKKVILATERFGKFLSDKKLDFNKIAQMKDVKKLLIKERITGSFGLVDIAKSAVDGVEDRGFKETMTPAFNALFALCENDKRYAKKSGKAEVIAEAIQFIRDELIPTGDQRKEIEELIGKLEDESSKFTNDAAKNRGSKLVKELKQHVDDYYSRVISHGKFISECKKSMQNASEDIGKNASPSWKRLFEAFQYLLENLTLFKLKEKASEVTKNPHTFYAINKNVSRAMTHIREGIEKAGLPVSPTKRK